MVNLTSFTLKHELPISVRQFLDFFESAPHLREVDILPITSISDAQDGRLVPLVCLQRMDAGHHPSSSLFNHLLIPAGTLLMMGVDLPSPPIDGRPPRFIDNLKNLSNFTKIKLHGGTPYVRFKGPNGEVWMRTRATQVQLLLGSLANFDTSKTERLRIMDCKNPPSSDPVYQALLPMKSLHTLKLHRCQDSHIFIYALCPSMSSSGAMVCPKLEQLDIVYELAFDIRGVVATVAARASKGTKLKSVKISAWSEVVYSQTDMLELKKHVLDVECDP